MSGDLLVFSADMIHRGLYGLDRLALDILVFDGGVDGGVDSSINSSSDTSATNFADYVDADCLPSADLMACIEAPDVFKHALNLKAHAINMPDVHGDN